MQKHTKIYMKFFDYCIDDYILCEVTGCYSRAVDIHHIQARGMGGSSIDKNNIENLCALCRPCHEKAGASKEFNSVVKEIHLENVRKQKGID